MSRNVADPDKSDRVPEPGRSPRLRIARPGEKNPSGLRPRWYVVALILVLLGCPLSWWQGPWRSGGNANEKSERASAAQNLQAARETAGESSGEAVGHERLKLRQGINRQMAPRTLVAPEEERAAGQPQNYYIEPPSHLRARTIISELSGDTSGPAPGPASAQNSQNQSPMAPKNRSEAWLVSLSDLSDRLPAAFFSRGVSREEAIRAMTPASARWPELKETETRAKLAVEPGSAGESGSKAEGAVAGTAGKAVAAKQPISFQDVPFQVRNSVPMSISMLVYSKQPDERWAVIDGTTMREGQKAPSGLKVEEITPEGVILNYKGHSFYKVVRED